MERIITALLIVSLSTVALVAVPAAVGQGCERVDPGPAASETCLHASTAGVVVGTGVSVDGVATGQATAGYLTFGSIGAAIVGAETNGNSPVGENSVDAQLFCYGLTAPGCDRSQGVIVAGTGPGSPAGGNVVGLIVFCGVSGGTCTDTQFLAVVVGSEPADTDQAVYLLNLGDGLQVCTFGDLDDSGCQQVI